MPLTARISAGTFSIFAGSSGWPGGGGVKRNSPPYWSLAMMRPLLSRQRLTHDPARRWAPNTTARAWKPLADLHPLERRGLVLAHGEPRGGTLPLRLLGSLRGRVLPPMRPAPPGGPGSTRSARLEVEAGSCAGFSIALFKRVPRTSSPSVAEAFPDFKRSPGRPTGCPGAGAARGRGVRRASGVGSGWGRSSRGWAASPRAEQAKKRWTGKFSAMYSRKPEAPQRRSAVCTSSWMVWSSVGSG